MYNVRNRMLSVYDPGLKYEFYVHHICTHLCNLEEYLVFYTYMYIWFYAHLNYIAVHTGTACRYGSV